MASVWVRRYLLLLAVGENIPILLTRIFLGCGFYLTGSGKIANIDNLIKYFTELGVPFANLQAPFVARLEYYGAILLMLGLGTRLAAFLLSNTMLVALWLAEKEKFLSSWSPTSEVSPVEVVPFVYLLCLLWLVFRGGGYLSLDFGLWKLALRKFPSR